MWNTYMNSNGVIKARARWMLFFDASWTSTAVARKIGGKSDATQLISGFIFAVFTDQHVSTVCFPSMFLDISRPRNFKVGLSVPEVTLWSFVNWPFPRPRPPAARLLPRKWSLQGGWGGANKRRSPHDVILPWGGKQSWKVESNLTTSTKVQLWLKSGGFEVGMDLQRLERVAPHQTSHHAQRCWSYTASSSHTVKVMDCSNPTLTFWMEARLTFFSMHLTLLEQMIFLLLTEQVVSCGLTFLKKEKTSFLLCES